MPLRDWEKWKQSINRELKELKRRIDAIGDQELYLSVARERGGVPEFKVPWPPPCPMPTCVRFRHFLGPHRTKDEEVP